MTTYETSFRSKLGMDGKIVKQELKFKYFEMEILGYEDIETEVRG